jgi:hypothetical protein
MGIFTPAGISAAGSFASGLGSIASAFGLGGNDGPSFRTQLNDSIVAQNEHMHYGALRAIRSGKQLGLNPLTLLGKSPINGFTAQYNSPQKGPDLEALGQGIDRAANAGRSMIQRKLDEEALEHARLQNDYLKTQIAGSQIAIANTGATVPVGTGIGSKHANSPDRNEGFSADALKRVKSDRPGFEDGIAQKHKLVMDDRGDPIRVLNTDVVGDNEILMLQDALVNTFPDMARNEIRALLKTVLGAPGRRWKKIKKKYYKQKK